MDKDEFLKSIDLDDLPNRTKFSEERYFRLENVVYNLLKMLAKQETFIENDVGDFMHYLEFGEWK
jgi:hypothetical protein